MQSPTRGAGSYSEPLRIIARFDAVHIHRGGQLVLDGLAARMVSELVRAQVPLDWVELLLRQGDVLVDET